MLAYEEAAEQYGARCDALKRRGSAEDAERCELTLALADAQARAGRGVAARDSFLAAAGIARVAGLSDELVQAVLGFAAAAAGRVEFGKVDNGLVALLEEALDGLGEQDGAARARVMSRLAQALYWSESTERRVCSSPTGAVDMARRLDDTATLAYTVNARRTALWDTESIEDRLAAGMEIVDLAERAGAAELHAAGTARPDRRPARARRDRGGRRRDRGARPPREGPARSGRLWHDALWRAMRALLDGRFDEAERHADRALAIGAPMRGRTAGQYHWMQIFWIRREQGRLDEIPPAQWSDSTSPFRLAHRNGGRI